MKRVALLLALVLASTAGAASTADPGVSAKRILLGGTVPLSGEASAFGSVGPGAKAYFDYVNTKGGVFGPGSSTASTTTPTTRRRPCS